MKRLMLIGYAAMLLSGCALVRPASTPRTLADSLSWRCDSAAWVADAKRDSAETSRRASITWMMVCCWALLSLRP